MQTKLTTLQETYNDLTDKKRIFDQEQYKDIDVRERLLKEGKSNPDLSISAIALELDNKEFYKKEILTDEELNFYTILDNASRKQKPLQNRNPISSVLGFIGKFANNEVEGEIENDNPYFVLKILSKESDVKKSEELSGDKEVSMEEGNNV